MAACSSSGDYARRAASTRVHRPDLRGETEIVAADYPFPDLVWTAVVVASLAAFVWLVVMALGDAWRRRDIDRATKAGWTLLVVLVPLAGVFAYLIANGEGMARRKAERTRTR
ncbi:MAG TPA: PLD nuclease N-terminal domain-containing protein [Gaiella sp.]|nr:PLD nuclease N-terminal domain-containing protein [Gaiella sp.]